MATPTTAAPAAPTKKPITGIDLFHADEIVKDNRGATILKVGGRLRLLHEDHDLEPGTEAKDRTPIREQVEVVEFKPRESAVVKVTLDTKRGRFVSHGTADKMRDSRLSSTLLEVAETRARARALRFAGYGLEFVSAEEMEGLDKVEAAPLSLDGPPTPAQLEAIQKHLQELAEVTGEPASIQHMPETLRDAADLSKNLREEVERLTKEKELKERKAIRAAGGIPVPKPNPAAEPAPKP